MRSFHLCAAVESCCFTGGWRWSNCKPWFWPWIIIAPKFVQYVLKKRKMTLWRLQKQSGWAPSPFVEVGWAYRIYPKPSPFFSCGPHNMYDTVYSEQSRDTINCLKKVNSALLVDAFRCCPILLSIEMVWKVNFDKRNRLLFGIDIEYIIDTSE